MKKAVLDEKVSVPFVITKTKLEREPKAERRRHWRGFRAGFQRILYQAAIATIDLLQDAFFEEEIKVDDGGVIESRHYAVFVEDEGAGPSLRVEEMPWRPGCAAHYELVSLASDADKLRAQNRLHGHTASLDPRAGVTTIRQRATEANEAVRGILLAKMGAGPVEESGTSLEERADDEPLAPPVETPASPTD